MTGKRVGLLALAVFGTLFPISALLALLAAFGYAIFMSSQLFAAIGIKILIITIVPIYAAVRTLFRASPEPQGLPLDREDAPELFERIDSIARRINAPRVRHVLVNDDFNCGIVQRARFGIAGVHESYLLIGLPLMQSLTPSQFEAVLAHECGHLSRRHGAAGARIHAVTQSWKALAVALMKHGRWIAGPILRFYRWLIPLFERLSFDLRRAQEREADLCAAEIAGSRTTAEMLLATRLRRHHLDEHLWENLQIRAALQAQPPDRIFQESAERGRETLADARMLYAAAASAKPDPLDSHPGFTERIAALGLHPEDLVDAVSEPLKMTAANAFLPGERIERQLSSEWKRAATGTWKQWHAAYGAKREKLERLDALAAQSLLLPSQQRERAFLAVELQRDDAQALLSECERAGTADTRTLYEIGRLVLPANSKRGERYLLDVAKRDVRFAVHAIADLAAYYTRCGDRENAARFDALLSQERTRAEVVLDRLQSTFDGPLEPHGLDEAQLSALRTSLAKWDVIEHAYLCRRSVPEYPDTPVYLCLLVRRPAKSNIEPAIFAKNVAASAQLPPSTSVFVAERDAVKWLPLVQAVAEAMVYAAVPSSVA